MTGQPGERNRASQLEFRVVRRDVRALGEAATGCACGGTSPGIVRSADDLALRVYRSLQHFGEFNGRRAEPECLARTLVEFPSDLIEVRLGVAR